MNRFLHIFHNTIFQPDQWLPTGGPGGRRIGKRTVSRDNTLHVRSPENYSASNNSRNTDDDFDYDLFNGKIQVGQETHGVRGEPIYADGAGLDLTTKAGHFRLAPGGSGVNAGQVVPNFSDRHTGKAPDIGAHQPGEPRIRYGVGASQPQSKEEKAFLIDRCDVKSTRFRTLFAGAARGI